MKIISILLLSFLVIPVSAKHLHYESVYQNAYCNSINGKTEVELKDFTRVDCLTDEYAIEIDFGKKWGECVGQALHYSHMTGKKPACALIIEKEEEKRYIKRIHNMPVFVITPEIVK